MSFEGFLDEFFSFPWGTSQSRSREHRRSYEGHRRVRSGSHDRQARSGPHNRQTRERRDSDPGHRRPAYLETSPATPRRGRSHQRDANFQGQQGGVSQARQFAPRGDYRHAFLYIGRSIDEDGEMHDVFRGPTFNHPAEQHNCVRFNDAQGRTWYRQTGTTGRVYHPRGMVYPLTLVGGAEQHQPGRIMGGIPTSRGANLARGRTRVEYLIFRFRHWRDNGSTVTWKRQPNSALLIGEDSKGYWLSHIEIVDTAGQLMAWLATKSEEGHLIFVSCRGETLAPNDVSSFLPRLLICVLELCRPRKVNVIANSRQPAIGTTLFTTWERESRAASVLLSRSILFKKREQLPDPTIPMANL